MSRPQVVQGTSEELLAFLEQHRSRDTLTLIIPSEEPGATSSQELSAANDRLRAHVLPIAPESDLDNTAIDSDLAKAYSSDLNCR